MRSTSTDFLEVLSHNKDTSVWLYAERHGGTLCVRRRMIFTSLDVPFSALPLHTSLQAVAERIHSTSLITVCCLYFPPNTVIHQHDLNNLVDQLPAPFFILGDFTGQSTLWGSVKTNPSGRQIEQVLSNHCLCLLNHEEPTYFHEPTRSFHTLDLAICSPSLFPNLNLSVEKDLYNSDHFPVILSHDSDTGGKTFPPIRILIVLQTGPFSHSWL
ncbi:putative RNA-directed DNA polymerase from transposon X-element [Trichonephila clavipes]|nr:putative RNA-directed DNA polymerase from transposon X-element [Trichonephila clavipes]